MPDNIQSRPQRQLSPEETENILGAQAALRSAGIDVPDDPNEFFQGLNDPENFDNVHKFFLQYQDTPKNPDDFRAMLGIVSPNLVPIPQDEAFAPPPEELKPQGLQYEQQALAPEQEALVKRYDELASKLDRNAVTPSERAEYDKIKESALVLKASQKNRLEELQRVEAVERGDILRFAELAYGGKEEFVGPTKRRLQRQQEAEMSATGLPNLEWALKNEGLIPENNPVVDAVVKAFDLPYDFIFKIADYGLKGGITGVKNLSKAMSPLFTRMVDMGGARGGPMNVATAMNAAAAWQSIPNETKGQMVEDATDAVIKMATGAFQVATAPIFATAGGLKAGAGLEALGSVGGPVGHAVEVVMSPATSIVAERHPDSKIAQSIGGLLDAAMIFTMATSHAKGKKVWDIKTKYPDRSPAEIFPKLSKEFWDQIKISEDRKQAMAEFLDEYTKEQGTLLPSERIAAGENIGTVVKDVQGNLISLRAGERMPEGATVVSTGARVTEPSGAAVDLSSRIPPAMRTPVPESPIVGPRGEPIPAPEVRSARAPLREAEAAAMGIPAPEVSGEMVPRPESPRVVERVGAEPQEVSRPVEQPSGERGVFRQPTEAERVALKQLGYSDQQIAELGNRAGYVDLVLNKKLGPRDVNMEAAPTPTEQAAPAFSERATEFQRAAAAAVEATKQSVGAPTAGELGRLLVAGGLSIGAAQLAQAVVGSEDDGAFSTAVAAVGGIGGFMSGRGKFVPSAEVKSRIGTKAYNDLVGRGFLKETKSGVPARQAAIWSKAAENWKNTYGMETLPNGAELLEWTVQSVGEPVKVKHFSSYTQNTGELIVKTEPKFAGSGVGAGEEVGRKRVPVTYFYKVEGKPEKRLASFPEYRALVEKVYDLDSDVIGVGEFVRSPYEMEKTLKSMGFNGYAKGNTVAVFKPQDVVRIRKTKMGSLIPVEYLDGSEFTEFSQAVGKYGLGNEEMYKRVSDRVGSAFANKIASKYGVEVKFTDNYGWWMSGREVSVVPNFVFEIKGGDPTIPQKVMLDLTIGLDQASGLAYRFADTKFPEPVAGEKPTQAIVIEKTGGGKLTQEQVTELTKIISDASNGRMSGGLIFEGNKVIVLRVSEYMPDYMPEQFVKDGVKVRDKIMDSDYLSEQRQFGQTFEASETSAFYSTTGEKPMRRSEAYEPVIPEAPAIQRPTGPVSDVWRDIRSDVNSIFKEETERVIKETRKRAFEALPEETRKLFTDEQIQSLRPDDIEALGRMGYDFAMQVSRMTGKGLTAEALALGRTFTPDEAVNRLKIAKEMADESLRLNKELERFAENMHSEEAQAVLRNMEKIGIERQRIREELEGFVSKAAEDKGWRVLSKNSLNLDQIETIMRELGTELFNPQKGFPPDKLYSGPLMSAGMVGAALYQVLSESDKDELDGLVMAGAPILLLSPHMYRGSKFRGRLTEAQKANAFDPVFISEFLQNKAGYTGTLESLHYSDFLRLSWDYYLSRYRDLELRLKETDKMGKFETKQAKEDLNNARLRLKAMRGLLVEPKHVGMQVLAAAEEAKSPITDWQTFKTKTLDAINSSYDPFVGKEVPTKKGSIPLITEIKTWAEKMNDAKWKHMFEQTKKMKSSFSKKLLDKQLPTIQYWIDRAQEGLRNGDYAWYNENIAGGLNKVLRDDTEMFIRLFSAANTGIANDAAVALALRALLQYKEWGDVKGIAKGAIGQQLEAAVKGELFGAQKIFSYAPSNYGFADALVADRWIARLYGFEKVMRSELGKGKDQFIDASEYQTVVATWQRLMEDPRMREYATGEVQAAIWGAAGAEKKSPLMGLIQDYMNRLPEVKGMDDVDKVKIGRYLYERGVVSEAARLYLEENGGGKIDLSQSAAPFALAIGLTAYELLQPEGNDDEVGAAGLVELPALIGLSKMRSSTKLGKVAKNKLIEWGNELRDAVKDGKVLPADAPKALAERIELWTKNYAKDAQLTPEQIASLKAIVQDPRKMRDMVEQMNNTWIEHKIDTNSNRILEEHGIDPKTIEREIMADMQRMSTPKHSLGTLTSLLKSRFAWLVDRAGQAGAELGHRLFRGDIKVEQLRKKGWDYIKSVGAILEEHGYRQDVHATREVFEPVIKALEDRANSDKYLTTQVQKDVYVKVKEFFDFYREQLEAAGIKTLDDYYTHARWSKVWDDLVESADVAELDKPKISKRALQETINAESRLLRERKGETDYRESDILSVMTRYQASVAKSLAYMDAVEYLHGRFRNDLSPLMAERFMTHRSEILEYVRNTMKPKKAEGSALRFFMKARSVQYQSFLWNSFKSTLENYTQLEMARAKWTADASKAERRLFGKYKVVHKGEESPIQGPLADAVREASLETPRYIDLWGDEMKIGKIGRLMEKWNTFRLAEQRNWRRAELGSIIDAAMKDKRWNETLKRNNGDVEAALNDILRIPEVYQKSVRHAAVISAETQVSPAPSMRADVYTNPLLRVMLSFTAFKFRQAQVFGQLFYKLSGADGEHAKAILKRGISEEAKPVEALREVEHVRKQLERLVVDYKKSGKGNIEAANTIIQRFKQEEANLNKIIKEIEPLSGSVARSAGVASRYIGSIILINTMFTVLWDLIGLGSTSEEELGERGTPEYMENLVENALMRGVVQGGGMPYQNRSSVLPENIGVIQMQFLKDMAGDDNASTRQWLRPLLNYGVGITPFLGVADRVSGRRIQEVILETVAPKKNQKKSSMFKAPSFKGGIGKSPLGK